ncbi:MAG TPA: enoyl-CoA hydratase/isomerase family protein [Candidatus Hydrogenedentes bacterium]|nr:enoyl-CoA hydratase/isomerase family protein [Candidatus Hydrogenedentota bacterium]
MNTIEIEFKEHVAVVRFNRPKANAINMDMVNNVRDTFLKLAESNTVDGVILTSKGSIFSAGLDVVELYDYDEDKMIQFWESFGRMLSELVAFPKPLIAAINGHAPAGGCVFALCCDHRIMAYGKGKIGLNEVSVGVVVPEPIIEIARFAVGNHKASQMLFNGLLLNAGDAQDFGLIDEACKEEELMLWAETKLKKWMDMPREPWKRAKHSINRPLLEKLRAFTLEEAFGNTLNSWWEAENRTQVGKLVKKLSGKSSISV